MGVPGTPGLTHRRGSDRGPFFLLHDVQDDLRVRALDVLHRDEVLDEQIELLRVLETRDDHAVVLARDVVHVDDLVLPPDLPLDLEELPLRDPDADHREDVVPELLLVEDGDVPDDDPLLLEALHAVADRADADLQLPRDVPEALPRIRVQPPEDRDVEFVEELHGHGGPRRARRYLSLSRGRRGVSRCPAPARGGGASGSARRSVDGSSTARRTRSRGTGLRSRGSRSWGSRSPSGSGASGTRVARVRPRGRRGRRASSPRRSPPCTPGSGRSRAGSTARRTVPGRCRGPRAGAGGRCSPGPAARRRTSCPRTPSG